MSLRMKDVILGAALALLLSPATALAALSCPVPPAQALAYARTVLASPQEAFMTDRDRAALICVIDALAEDKAGGDVAPSPDPADSFRDAGPKAPSKPGLAKPD